MILGNKCSLCCSAICLEVRAVASEYFMPKAMLNDSINASFVHVLNSRRRQLTIVISHCDFDNNKISNKTNQQQFTHIRLIAISKS